ncbi:MAG: translation initiation factor [Kosmotogales bacterium]|nr:translation initiation factor [Kosmotogales bacterium]
MSKKRVYELAKELNISAKELIDELLTLGVEVKNHMSSIDDDIVATIKELYADEKKGEKKEKTVKKISSKPKPKDIKNFEKKETVNKDKKNEKEKKTETPKRKNERKRFKEEIKEKKIEKKEEEIVKTVNVKPEDLKLDILSQKMKIPVSKIIKDQFMKGLILRPGQSLSLEDAITLTEDYGWNLEIIEEEIIDPIKKLKKNYDELYDKNELVLRPPVVTVMGHVDHGKTTLLDNIRNTKVADKEAGGITQTIGAYQVEVDGKKITFIDTPGHEAFTEMRARGAQATDIVILMVAADDGVMPQTIEAYNHAKTANVPIIVAINKIDKPNANVEFTKQQLASKLKLVAEDWGGDTVTVPISAKTGEGVDELLEMILLVSEMSDIKCYPEGNARGIIIESNLDKAIGPVASVIIKDGILKLGDYIVAGQTCGKVKALTVGRKRVRFAGPSQAVQILGFNDVPDVHSIIYVVDNLEQARLISDFEKQMQKKKDNLKGNRHIRLEDLVKGEKENKELNLILKAESFGSVEALKQAIAKLENDEVHIEIRHASIGAINSSDILLASASNSVVLGFKVKPDASARKQAEIEDVQIKTYDIIFELINDLKRALEGLLEPEKVEEISGSGEIKKVFKINKVGSIAGVQLHEGYASKKGFVRIYRNNQEIFDGKIESLKHYKDEASQVSAPQECGIKFLKFDEIESGDQLQFRVIKEVKKTIDFKK